MPGNERCNSKNKVIIANEPNELWVADLIGRISCKDGTNKFIFVAIDHYSKWVKAKIIDSKKKK
ncbi:hypothetical protein ENBRE01_2591 [Enteropsectra breve]|nr:hypothetical protein ENBRE01_2591 [Enteropsectra breve]